MFGTGSRVVLISAVVLTLGTVSRADEDIAIDKLPGPVVKAIKDRFPKGELRSAEKETDDGKVEYEVKVRSDGKKYEVEVTPDGKINEVDDDD